MDTAVLHRIDLPAYAAKQDVFAEDRACQEIAGSQLTRIASRIPMVAKSNLRREVVAPRLNPAQQGFFDETVFSHCMFSLRVAGGGISHTWLRRTHKPMLKK